MSYHIAIDDLVANAFIETIKKSKKKNNYFLSFKQVEKYGIEVVKILRKNGNEVELILSKRNTEELFREFPDFFIQEEKNGRKGISLQQGKTVDDLISHFRGYLALDVLLALTDELSVNCLHFS